MAVDFHKRRSGHFLSYKRILYLHINHFPLNYFYLNAMLRSTIASTLVLATAASALPTGLAPLLSQVSSPLELAQLALK